MPGPREWRFARSPTKKILLRGCAILPPCFAHLPLVSRDRVRVVRAGLHSPTSLRSARTRSHTSMAMVTISTRGLIVGFPTALPTGLSRGIGGGMTVGRAHFAGARASLGDRDRIGARLAGHPLDLRFRVAAQPSTMRGAARSDFVGAGGTLVHEARERNQGMRAGLMGDALETSAFPIVPAAELEAVVSVHMVGSWLLVMSGGPSVALVGGSDSMAAGSPSLGWVATMIRWATLAAMLAGCGDLGRVRRRAPRIGDDPCRGHRRLRHGATSRAPPTRISA